MLLHHLKGPFLSFHIFEIRQALEVITQVGHREGFFKTAPAQALGQLALTEGLQHCNAGVIPVGRMPGLGGPCRLVQHRQGLLGPIRLKQPFGHLGGAIGPLQIVFCELRHIGIHITAAFGDG